MTKGKKNAIGFLILVSILAVFAGGLAGRLLRPILGEHTGEGRRSGAGLGDLWQIVGNPRDGFPGKNRISILCMGLDDNWTNKDMVYTVASRTDTLFLLTLDLDNKRVSMLSIPRDTYAHIAGTHWNFKINAAYQTGGPARTVQTVNELLSVSADHYLVLNLDATRKMVDALGGVDVDVPHEMHYHDKWGHLSIDLMPGSQHLMGDQAVGFARYRHPDAGKKATPEDGDERRMARQHLLLRAMIDRAKTLGNVTQGPHLIDVGMSAIRTDLTRTQLFDLAALFHSIQQSDIRTASLPGDDFRGPNGEWFYKLDEKKKRDYTAWLVRGDETAARRLVSVVVRNGTKTPGLAGRVVAQLASAGYTDVSNGGNALPRVQMTSQTTTGAFVPRTLLLDSGVPVPETTRDVEAVLGLSNVLAERVPGHPNKAGWTAPPTLTITLGQDYADALKSADLLNVQPQKPSTSGQN